MIRGARPVPELTAMSNTIWSGPLGQASPTIGIQ
jgi:hypothetical protein